MRKTIWPALALFCVTLMVIHWWRTSAAPPVAEAAIAGTNEVPAAPVHAASQVQDGWQRLPYVGEDYNAKKVATVSLKITEEPNAAKDLATDTPTASEPPAATPQDDLMRCRKHLRTLHLPKVAPKVASKGGGLLDPQAPAAKADPGKAVAILNQRIRNADDCLKRAARGG